jgi:aerobic carbon-monoxide dehydrogenase small subunit
MPGGRIVKLVLRVNGRAHTIDGVPPWQSLLGVLRDQLSLFGSKNACEQGECGSCSVMLDGEVVCSCLVMAPQAQGRDVRTIEGLDDDPVAREVRRCMVDGGGVQCGFCTPGFVVAATGALTEDPTSSDEALREALSGNLCRCTGYAKILESLAVARDVLVLREDGR